MKNVSAEILKAEKEDANKTLSKDAERDREMDNKKRADAQAKIQIEMDHHKL